MNAITNEPLYQCGACGLWYREEERRNQCEAWCKTHQSCNLEIIAHAVNPESTGIKGDND